MMGLQRVWWPFYAIDHDPESPNLYKGDYAIQLMNDIVFRRYDCSFSKCQ